MNRGQPWFSAGLAAAAVIAWLLPGQGAALGWEPGATPWRLLTSQLAHWDGNHLGWDALALLILGAWAECGWPASARVAILIALVAVPPIIVLAHPGLAFRGLSGVACALATVAMIRTWRDSLREDDLLAAAIAASLLLGLLAKIAFETLAGRAVFATAALWQPLPLAHALGMGAGLLASVRLPKLFPCPPVSTC